MVGRVLFCNGTSPFDAETDADVDPVAVRVMLCARSSSGCSRAGSDQGSFAPGDAANTNLLAPMAMSARKFV